MRLLIWTIFIICSSALFATALHSHDEKERLRIASGCMIVANYTNEEWLALKQRKFAEPTMEFKCFARCLFESVGLTKNGIVQSDNEAIIQEVPDKNKWTDMRTALTACREKTKASVEEPCENGYVVFLCLTQYHDLFPW